MQVCSWEIYLDETISSVVHCRQINLQLRYLMQDVQMRHPVFPNLTEVEAWIVQPRTKVLMNEGCGGATRHREVRGGSLTEIGWAT